MPVEAAAPSQVLAATKLEPPVAHAIVERPQPVRALVSSTKPLNLIRAPAGWGKSTLLAAWYGAPDEGRRFAWLALDPWDDDPVRLWSYVIEALRTLDDSIGSSSLRLLNAPGTGIVDDVLPSLLNDLAERSEPAVLVLDDYHVITDPEIHEQVGFFVERLPRSLQVVLATRAVPPLPLGRMRARGELFELGVDELRFDPGEAHDLLDAILGLELEPEQEARLHQRTEGWVAGLYLAGVSLRGSSDRASFVERFAGDDRHVADYLAAEVLRAQRPEFRQALLRTSILDRFCGPLVEAVAGVADGRVLLREIEQANLFLVPLDSRREWYRYHHLFQQLLRVELSARGPDSVSELHARAARWHLDAGFVPEAIEHTIAAGDTQAAGELIARHWAPALLETAGDHVVDSWLTALGDDAVAGDIRLCFARCFIGLSYGDMDGVATWLAIAERAPLTAPFRDGITSVEGALAVVRTAYLWERGNVRGALESGEKALAAEGEGSPWRAIGAATIGLAKGAVGNFQEGRRWALEYARLGRAFGQHLNETSGLGTAAVFDAECGAWDSAEELAKRSQEISFDHGINEHWSGASCHLALGLVLEHEGQREDAELQIERAATLDRRGAGPVELGWALLHLARLQAGRGDHAAARASIEEATERLARAPDPGNLLERLERARRQITAQALEAVGGDELSERELDVLRLLATPMTQREIGAELYVSLNTVKTHTKSIFRKLDASERSEAVARARELGLL